MDAIWGDDTNDGDEMDIDVDVDVDVDIDIEMVSSVVWEWNRIWRELGGEIDKFVAESVNR